MNIVIRDLKTALEKLETQLAAIETEREEVTAMVENYRAVIAHQQENLTESPVQYVPADVLRNEIERILEAEDNPLHYREIHTRLVAGGFKVRGEDPVKNTGAHLSSDRRFVVAGQGRWKLAKWAKKPPMPNQTTVVRPTRRPDDTVANDIIERLLSPITPPQSRIGREIPPIAREAPRPASRPTPN